MAGEQKIRALLFYLSVFVFFATIPFLLSFALGYKFNKRTFTFTKTGLISVKTQPEGAQVYLDGKLLNEKTPLVINELVPGNYNLKIELAKYYPWAGQVHVEAQRAAPLEKIILFPFRPNIKQLNKEKISSFLIDEKAEKVYYIDTEENAVYESDLEGEDFQEVGALPNNIQPYKKWKVSPDKEKLLVFGNHQIAVFYLETHQESSATESPVVLDYPDINISEVFWHSDSYHLLIVTTKNIEVTEARPGAAAVALANLNKKNTTGFYNEKKDAFYFIDSQKAPDGKTYDNVYELELGAKSYPLQELIKIKPVPDAE